MNRSISWLAPVLAMGCLASLSLAGCKKKSEGAPSPEAASESTRPRVSAKLSAYAMCLNELNPQFHENRHSYLRWADPKTGPSKKSSVSGFVEVGRDTTYGYQCFKRQGGLDEIETMSPKLEALDSAGSAYKKAVIEAMATTKSAAEYYQHGDYKDDQFKKGKELHASLMAAYSAVDRTSADLRAAMRTVKDKMSDERLAELEKSEGKQMEWHQIFTMKQAQLFLDAVDAESEPNSTSVIPAGAALARACEEDKAWTASNSAAAAMDVHWNGFVSACDELATQFEEMNRGFRDKKRAPKEGSGSAHEVVEKYNSLVRASNRLGS